jgi:hypothetical protein
MFKCSSIKAPLDLELVRTKEPLHTLIPLELLFIAPVREHNTSHNTKSRATHNLLASFNGFFHHQAVYQVATSKSKKSTTCLMIP